MFPCPLLLCENKGTSSENGKKKKPSCSDKDIAWLFFVCLLARFFCSYTQIIINLQNLFLWKNNNNKKTNLVGQGKCSNYFKKNNNKKTKTDTIKLKT